MPIAPTLVRANLTPQDYAKSSLQANAFASARHLPSHSVAPHGMACAAPATVQPLVQPAAIGHAAVCEQPPAAASWPCAMSMPAVSMPAVSMPAVSMPAVSAFVNHCAVPALSPACAGVAGDSIGGLPHNNCRLVGGEAPMRPPKMPSISQPISHEQPPAAVFAQSMPLSMPPSPPATPVWSCNIGPIGAGHAPFGRRPSTPLEWGVSISKRPSPLKRAHSAPIASSTPRSPAAQGSERDARKETSINSWLALLICSCALFNAQISWITGSAPGHLMTVSLTLMAALIVMPVHSKGHWLEMLWCVGVSAAPLFFLFDDSMRTPAQIVHRMAYLPVVAPFSALVYLVVGIVHSAQALPQQYLLTSITMLILLLAVRGMRLGTLTHQWDLATLGFATSALPCLGCAPHALPGPPDHATPLVA